MLEVLITLACVGVILWVISQIPMPAWILRLIYIVAILCVVFYLLNVFGVLDKLEDIPVPRFG